MAQPGAVESDDVMAAIGAAVGQGRAGERAPARDALGRLWEQAGDTGDALHRCSIAHYLADLQDAVEDELLWDQRALAAVADLNDERAQRFHASLQVRAFLPSLHLNLADAYRRIGDQDRAQHHLTGAGALAAELPDDAYGAMIRGGIRQVAELLAAGSREPLTEQ
jgi:hypothetical protein